jgi:hypothetical protein
MIPEVDVKVEVQLHYQLETALDTPEFNQSTNPFLPQAIISDVTTRIPSTDFN